VEGVLVTRAVLSLSGEEATAFLQGLVTQDVTGADPVFTALLTPQGKILFDFILAPVAGGYLIDCDATAAPALLKRLSMYKLRAKVTLAAETGLGVFLGARDGARASYADPRLSTLPVRTIAEVRSEPAADDAYDALRLAAGVPEFGRDFQGEEVFLLDVNYDALAGVSYRKGCFVGQEVTSRMKRKGDVRKRTLIARGASLAAGAPIMAGEGAIGEVLSVRGDQGLALIRLDRLAEARAGGSALATGGAPVQVDIPAYLEPA
jgi:tRNA-modifying protein YgfZ